jgi:D-3-phosphoglycerate dehydrogenase / 2-oxoglutarate reductase
MEKRLKVVVTDYIEGDLEWEKAELTRRGFEFEALQLKFRPEEEVVARIADADIIVVNMVKMTEAVLSKLKNCRLLIRHGIGYDNVDVPACTKHGIQFAYQPDYCTEDVAEHAIALICACARKLPRSRRILEASSAADQWDFTGLMPLRRMHGKTLGILGVGRIGSRVCQKMISFGFHILGCDPYLTAARMAELGIDFVDADTLFSESDFLTIHTLLNDETRHIVDARRLALMKPTAYLVNTSRGPMIDMPALVSALKAGRPEGAAIDVFDREPPTPDFELFRMDNVILTPHVGWASQESGWDIRRKILDDILLAAEGKPARYVINPEVFERGTRTWE